MDRKEINERIAFLFTALMYCADIKTTFSSGERIMINQERGQWMHICDYPGAEPRIVSIDIEIKLKKAEKAIADYDQQYPHQNLFKDESKQY